MTFEPKGIITLCKVPFESNMKHNFVFKSKAERDTYFNGLADVVRFSDYTYIRKDSAIKFNGNYEQLKNYNYCFYLNANFTNELIFAYILDLKYTNENCCTAIIKTDSWQTFHYKVIDDKKSISFVERMIVAKKDDGIGDNYITENLETGEYYIRGKDEANIDYTEITPTLNYTRTYAPMIVIGTTEKLDESINYGVRDSGFGYNGVFSGLYYLVFAQNGSAYNYIRSFDARGKGDAIYTMFMCPSSLIITKYNPINYYSDTITGEQFGYYPMSPYITSNEAVNINNVITQLNDLKFGDYTPKNKKLYTYPFSYLRLDNNAGNSTTYRYEYFKNPLKPEFRVDASFTQGCSIRITPKDYKGIDNNWSEGLDYMKFPTCSWNNDVYTNWLTQTAVSRMNTRTYVNDMSSISSGKNLVNGLIGVGELVLGATAKNDRLMMMGASSVSSSIFNQQAEQRNYEQQLNDLLATEFEHSLVPNSASNGNNMVEVNFSLGLYNVSIYHMRITSEYCRIIDNYFTMYGYKVNAFKNINDCIFTRNQWNYVKTVDCQINIDIADEYLREIKDMFNKGVTLWHNPNAIYKYNEYENE